MSSPRRTSVAAPPASASPAAPDRAGLVVSPDGRNLYYTAGTSNTVAAMQRDAATGGLTPVPDDPARRRRRLRRSTATPGWPARRGWLRRCARAGAPTSLAITPDGPSCTSAAVWTASPSCGATRRRGRSPRSRDPTGRRRTRTVSRARRPRHHGCVRSTVGRGLRRPGRHRRLARIRPEELLRTRRRRPAARRSASCRTPATGRIQAIGPDDPRRRSGAASRGASQRAAATCRSGNVFAVPVALALSPDGSRPLPWLRARTALRAACRRSSANSTTGVAVPLPANNSGVASRT